MEWAQLASLFLANAGLIVWFRAESRADWRHMDSKVDAIQNEMKDFHEKLLKIEIERGMGWKRRRSK
jgi:hypothetical protein